MCLVLPGRDLMTRGLLLHLLLSPIGHLERIHGDTRLSLLARIQTPHHQSSISCHRGAQVGF